MELPRHTEWLFNAQMEKPLHVSGQFGEVALFSAGKPGIKGRLNEDAALLAHNGSSSCLLAIADGVGGGRCGEIASRVTIEQLANAAHGCHERSMREAVLDAVDRAHDAICNLRVGAGATFIAATCEGRAVRTYHAGDCSAFVVGGRGLLKMLTVAHSPVGYALEAGIIDEVEAMYDSCRHLISNMLGANSMSVEVSAALQMAPRDTLVLGSDGLFDNLFIGEVAEMVRKGPLQYAASAVAEAAQRRMLDDSDEETPRKLDDLTFVLWRPAKQSSS